MSAATPAARMGEARGHSKRRTKRLRLVWWSLPAPSDSAIPGSPAPMIDVGIRTAAATIANGTEYAGNLLISRQRAEEEKLDAAIDDQLQRDHHEKAEPERHDASRQREDPATRNPLDEHHGAR